MARQTRAYLVLVVGVEVELCERPQAGGRDGSRKTRIANAHGDDFPGGGVKPVLQLLDGAMRNEVVAVIDDAPPQIEPPAQVEQRVRFLLRPPLSPTPHLVTANGESRARLTRQVPSVLVVGVPDDLHLAVESGHSTISQAPQGAAPLQSHAIVPSKRVVREFQVVSCPVCELHAVSSGGAGKWFHGPARNQQQ